VEPPPPKVVSQVDQTVVKELESRVRSLLVESNENNKIIAAKGELIQKLENKIAKQYETIGNIVELEGMREKMKSKLKYKDSIIDDLKKQVIARKRELGYLSDENQGTSIDKKYESVISSLREELTVKEKNSRRPLRQTRSQRRNFLGFRKTKHENRRTKSHSLKPNGRTRFP